MILDLSGTSFLYPVDTGYYGFTANISINKQTYEIIPYLKTVSEGEYPGRFSPWAYLISPNGFYVIILIVVSLILYKSKFISKLKKK